RTTPGRSIRSENRGRRDDPPPDRASFRDLPRNSPGIIFDSLGALTEDRGSAHAPARALWRTSGFKRHAKDRERRYQTCPKTGSDTSKSALLMGDQTRGSAPRCSAKILSGLLVRSAVDRMRRFQ